ncbi:hypothetical protein [Flavobacterium sp.]|uniref:hypothetical protein n=1 Tax=Flavobacterium sp. TaxID=239 RepID=UPI0037509BBD
MLKNKKTFLPLAILWTCIITFLSLVSFTADVGSQIHVPYKDKYVHFAFYFIFVVFWASFINGKSNNSFTNCIILIFAIQYGVFMEICQGTLLQLECQIYLISTPILQEQ